MSALQLRAAHRALPLVHDLASIAMLSRGRALAVRHEALRPADGDPGSSQLP
jgi:hypothetical protein